MVEPICPIVLDASYKGDEITQKVASILKLGDIKQWSVVDTDGDLALVHYEEDADKNQYGYLRGVVVDTKNECVVANSYGYTPIAIADKIVPQENLLSFTDLDGVEHHYDLENVELKRVFEGVILRLIWYNGELKVLTHRKIKTDKSRWVITTTFKKMFEQANGPKVEDLFDTSKKYSSTCYFFLVVHPELLIATRQNVEAPYLVHLCSREMDLPFEDIAVGTPKFFSTKEIKGEVKEPCIHTPENLSLEEANKFLSFGYYEEFKVNDFRVATGEALMLYDKKSSAILKIHSPSFHWRFNMRGNNPNLYHQFVSLVSSVFKEINTPDEWLDLCEKYIPVQLYTKANLESIINKNGSLIYLPADFNVSALYGTKDMRINLLFVNFVFSLPINRQKEALEFLNKFFQERQQLTDWIINKNFTLKNLTEGELSARVINIITTARRLAKQNIERGKNVNRHGTSMTEATMIKTTIKNFVANEYGPSIYSLIKEMKKDLAPKEK